MIIPITGDRNWSSDKEAIRKFIEYFYELAGDKLLEIVQGGTRGADTLAREV